MVTSVTEQNIHLVLWIMRTGLRALSSSPLLLTDVACLLHEISKLASCSCVSRLYVSQTFIMARKAATWVCTTSRTQIPAQAAQFLTLVQKLYNNPHLNKNYFELDGGHRYLRSGKEVELVDRVDRVPTVDA
jgi:hypothetical protein